MGFIKTIELQESLIIENAYHRIGNISGNKSSLTIFINCYVSKEAYENNPDTPYLKQTSFGFIPSQDDESLRWDKQAYEHAKNLPEFEGAIDA